MPDITEQIRAPGLAVHRDRLGVAREATTLVRDIVIALLVLTCILRPDVLKSWLGALGVTKATLLGFEITPGGEKKLADEIDQLKQQRDAAIFERNSLARRARAALSELQRVKGVDPGVAREIQQLSRSTEPRPTGAGEPSVGAQAELVSDARKVIDPGTSWGVVFGGDLDLSAARDEIARAERGGITSSRIFNRGNSFRSLALAASAEDAESLLQTARRRLRPDAYIVNLSKWCPIQENRAGFVQCQ